MTQFEFGTAGRILFGAGSVEQVPAAASAMGCRAFVVTGGTTGRADALHLAMPHTRFGVDGEPTVDLVRAGTERALAEQCDVVIAIGGGSAIDAGKAIAALLANGGDPLDYLEVVGRGKALGRASAPFIAVPTTAGTGSEVTRNAVLGVPDHRVKASLRSAYMLPVLAVIDPELTYDLPPAVTASTGLDALTQVIEPYVSVRANAMTDLFCLEGMRRAARSLARACTDGRDREAREDMSFASLMGGLALANAGLGAVHGFAAPVGGMYSAPHGAVCAALLPHVMRANIKALRERDPGRLARYETVAGRLTGRDGARPEDGADFVADLAGKLSIPPLASYGITQKDIRDLVAKASKASSMKGNPVRLTAEELAGIVAAAL